MSFGIPVRNGLSVSLVSSTFLSSGRRLNPALNLDFLTGGPLDPRITFSRGSQATLVDSTGKLTYAPNNLLTNSETFEAAAWTKVNTTVTANTVAAPDGSLTADTLAATLANGSLQRSESASIGNNYIFSVWIKRKTGTGTISLTSASGTYSSVAVDSTWQRFYIASTATDAFCRCYIRLTTNGDEVYIWGAQLEQVTYQTTPGTYNSTSPKNLLGYTQEFDNAAWTKSNAFVQTNLLTYSQDFDNAAWGKFGVSVTPNTTADPNGIATADTTTALAATSNHRLISSVATIAVGALCVHSIYAKAGTHNFVQIHDGASASYFANFDLSTGTLGTVTGCTATITNVGNGWYRCAIAFTVATANPILAFGLVTSATAARNESWTAVGTETVFVWGAQIVQGATAGDYQRTDAAAAAVQYAAPDGTLSADNLISTGDGNVRQGATCTANTSYTASVWLRVTSGTSNINIYRNDNGTGFSQSTVAVTTTWQRFSITATSSGTATTAFFQIGGGSSLPSGSSLLVWGAQLSNSASLDPYVYNPVAAPTSAAYYGPRFDYDPVTLANKGLLIEEQRTNLLTYSEQFDNAAWAKTDTTVTANAIAAPSGTTTADLLTEGTAGTAQVGQTATISSGATATFSIYLKRGNTDWIRLLVADGANFFRAWFNLSTGAVGSSSAGGTGVLAGASVTNVSNGWYRVSLSGSIPATTTYSVFCCTATGDNSGTRVSNGTYYPWGAQLEAGAFATSYIPTVASQVTRSADVATMIGTNFSSWFNPNAGTVVAAYDNFYPANATSQGVTGFGSYGLFMYLNTSLVKSYDGTNVVQASAATANTATKTAVAYGSGLALSQAGGAAVTSSYNNVFASAALLYIGNTDGIKPLNGHIRSLAYYNSRLPNATLVTLTAPPTTPSLSLDFTTQVFNVG